MSSSAAFTGDVPAAYDRHLAYMFDPYATELVARVPGGSERVLELACGTGIVTKPLREALSDSAALVATDLNEAMLDHARAAVPAAGIAWQQADAQALPFDEGSFDAIVCAFGFMFLPDKVQGFREARRVLRRGGVLLGNVWRSKDANPTAEVIQGEIATLFPDDTPPFLDTPYGYHDEERIRADMSEAGWEDVTLEEVSIEVESTAVGVAAGYVRGTPLAGQVLERSGDVEAVERAVAGALAKALGSRPFRSSTAAVVINATR